MVFIQDLAWDQGFQFIIKKKHFLLMIHEDHDHEKLFELMWTQTLAKIEYQCVLAYQCMYVYYFSNIFIQCCNRTLTFLCINVLDVDFIL